jgi:hypothetical protein
MERDTRKAKQKAKQNGGIRMLVDKNGREITAGCKVLWGDTLCDIDWVGESHRKELQELCAKHMEVVDIDTEGECNLRLECKRTIQSSPIKEWLKEDV